MSLRTCWINGSYVSEADATVSIFDRSVLFGDGVYEVAAVFNGRLLDADRHLVRLERSMREIALPSAYPVAELEAVMQELATRGGITEGNGQLTAEWRELFTAYPDRFLVGSDTWIDQRWASYGDIIAGYRAWLAQLPPGVARQIASGNAKRLFAEP